MPYSPISVSSLRAAAQEIQRRFKSIAARAPLPVRLEVEAVMRGVADLESGCERAVRLRLARRLERLNDELRGRSCFDTSFYAGGRLGLIRLYEPVTVRGAVDTKRIEVHLRRYEERLDRSERRLIWLYRRAGLQVGEAPSVKPWERPYATFEEVHELVWRSRP